MVLGMIKPKQADSSMIEPDQEDVTKFELDQAGLIGLV